MSVSVEPFTIPSALRTGAMERVLEELQERGGNIAKSPDDLLHIPDIRFFRRSPGLARLWQTKAINSKATIQFDPEALKLMTPSTISKNKICKLQNYFEIIGLLDSKHASQYLPIVTAAFQALKKLHLIRKKREKDIT